MRITPLAALAALLLVPAPASADTSLAGRTIYVDAGHNGANGRSPQIINRLVDAGNGIRKPCNTTGTQTNDGRLTESAFNLRVAMHLRAKLRARGANVVMTRTTDDGVGPCIDRRAAIGNRAKADAVISIHADGGPPRGRGFHVIYPGRIRGSDPARLRASRRLAVLTRSALWSRGQRSANYIGRSGLDERTDLGGLNLSTRPAVFVELGNMRNARDARQMRSPAYRDRVAGALALGLVRFLRR
jgi:N-acetylmuramoyl-L-alanine amidase